MIHDVECRIISNTNIAENIYSIRLKIPVKFEGKIGGKFVNLEVPLNASTLRRPLGIAAYDEDTITVCYRVAGDGTRALSLAEKGSVLRASLPLGNGFEIPENAKKIVILGGGVGIFPLACVLKEISKNKDIESYCYLGFRSKKEICLLDTFSSLSTKLFVCTDDASAFEKGNAISLFMNNYKESDVILSCGPTPMLRGLKQTLEREKITTKTLVSTEERMGCGIGACLVCSCKKAGENYYYRVCKDGPVFDIWEVEI